MSLTLAYFTSRRNPHLEWFAASLRREIAREGFRPRHILIVDFHADEQGRREETEAALGPIVWDLAPMVEIIAPKPCVWQGPHRLTTNQYFAASNARNTAFARCREDFIACVDDLSVFAPGWLNQVRHAMEHKYVALGAYKKVLNLRVDKEGGIGFDPYVPGVDSRWNSGADGIVMAAGSWFFGCSFAMPLEAALTVNGFDEICDGQGAEDYDFGMRVERAGYKLFYNRNMLTYESEEGHSTPGNQHFIRLSKPMPYDGQYNIGSDHVLLRRVMRETDRVTTISNHYNLRELRNSALAGQPWPIMQNPQHDWRDGTPLSQM